MSIITLTTDFGTADGYVGVMKGVILSIAPNAQLVDLSHSIPAHDVTCAVNLLARSAPFFPPGTVHLAVVDPGVGGNRRPLLVTDSGVSYVAPDNGLLTQPLHSSSAQAWVLDRPEYWLTPLSSTFHGRDLFAPVAAHLARGVCAADLATRIDDPLRLDLPAARVGEDGVIHGRVITVDHFGNLLTNIPDVWLHASERWRCWVRGNSIAGVQQTYEAVASGELLLLLGSDRRLEIAMRDGSASDRLGVRAGEPLTVEPEPIN